MHHTLMAVPLVPDTTEILNRFGSYTFWAALVIVFIECGVFIFFLPGDTLLFAMGLLAARGTDIGAPLWLAILGMVVAAVGGNVAGYWLGDRVGTRFFKPDARIFKTDHLAKTHVFFDKYGNRAIVLARFVPIVRTFITLLAGASKMDWRRFIGYSAIGGVCWIIIVTMAGYWLGHVSFVRHNVELMVLLMAIVTSIPIVIEFLRQRKAGAFDVGGDPDHPTQRAAREG